MTSQVIPPSSKRDAQIFPHVSWPQFEASDRAFESIPGVKFRYLDGQLEIMSISPEHEDFKTTLRMLLEAYLRAKRILFYGRGGPSLGDRPDDTKGRLGSAHAAQTPLFYLAKIWSCRSTYECQSPSSQPMPHSLDRITIDPNRMNGRPCVRDLRLTVRRVLELLATYPD